jgi:hypothetical protein
VGGAVGGGDVRGTEKKISGLLYPAEFVIEGRAGGGVPTAEFCDLAAWCERGK